MSWSKIGLRSDNVRINVGITGKGYCFIDTDITYDEYMEDKENKVHEKIMKLIEEKYGTRFIQGYAPNEGVD